ncbi:MAG TPA: VWA domain-containing protein, partial [Planctomycetaceae bacterium]|nr:VWA domain-containing protein [Planctomycetaceae bacterium]
AQDQGAPILGAPFVLFYDDPAVTPTEQLEARICIAIDDSFSMGYQSFERGGVPDRRPPAAQARTLFDRAKQVVRRLVETAGPGDSFSLLRFCGPDRVLIAQPTPSRSAVLETLAALGPTEQPSDALPLAEQLRQVIRLPETPRRKHVVILSDFQRVGWQPTAEEEARSLRAAFRQLGQKGRLTLIDVGVPHASNTAIIDLTADRPFATIGQTTTMTARVRWFGSEDATASHQGTAAGELPQSCELQLYWDGRLRATASGRFDPTREAQVQFRLKVDEAGDHVVEVRCRSDALPADDRRWLVLPVRRSLRVLLVDGRPVGAPEETATFFVARALTPKGATAARAGVIQATVIRDDQLVGRTLSDSDCIVLCDVPVLTGDDLRALKDYVRAGGGVIIALGPNVDAAAYNAAAGPDGLLPASLGERVGDPAQPERVFGFDVGASNHPVLDVFRGNPEAGLETTPIFAYRRVRGADRSDVRVILAYDSGDPALL